MSSAKDKSTYLALADIYNLLSSGFSYPEKESVLQLKEFMSDFLTGSPPARSARYVRQLFELADHTTLQREYSEIFLKGTVASCESSYDRRVNILPDVSAYYRAFGFTPKSGDSPDSIIYELQYMSLLALKIFLAKSREQEEVSINAYNSFLQEHLREFSEKFSNRLRQTSCGQFYLTLAELLCTLTGGEPPSVEFL